MSEGTGS